MSKLFLLVFVVVVGCTAQTASNSESVETSIDTLPSIDSKLVEERQKYIPPSDTTSIVLDSSLYIGEASIFSETGEVYTPVYFRENVVTVDLFEYLQKQADSVIYEDVEVQRARIPISTARKYFNLSGLDTISVYHEAAFVGDALFVRVEYMEGLLESQFIAVFIPAKKIIFPEELDYCMSKGKHPYEAVEVTYQGITDEQLTSKLIDTFVLDSAQVSRVLHTHVVPYQSVYSAISMHSRLLLIETTADQSRILMDMNEDWYISDIAPLHLQSNGKPMLLLRMGVNETDMMWSAVAVFSGDSYRFAEDNRIGGLD